MVLKWPALLLRGSYYWIIAFSCFLVFLYPNQIDCIINFINTITSSLLP